MFKEETSLAVRDREGDTANGGYHLIAGPGGSRAILATSGMLMALEFFGVRTFKSIGGISGGSIPLRLFAAGLSIKQIVDMALELNFESMLDRELSIATVIAAHYRDGRYRGSVPSKGVFKTDRIGVWLESFSASWPAGYWTLAVKDDAQVLLTGSGVYSRVRGEKFRCVSSAAPPIGLSIQASCSVPGIFAPVDIPLESGEIMHLCDGGVSWEGFRPTSVAEEFFCAKPGEIIVCDVGPEPGYYSRLLNSAWRILCGGRCVPPRGRSSEAENEMLVVSPVVTSLASFDFSAHSDKKWQAIMEGFAATTRALNTAYRLTEEQYAVARNTMETFAGFVDALRVAPQGELSEHTRALLSHRGILD
ncbi:patatin-like phospholipase family protein [Candidatus Obscuribacterales bacterium]|nr:patatin-like phospholipase family protein [Candidatus Obscuribacterales bacterium]